MVELTSLSQTSTNTEYCIGRIEGVMDGIDELVGGYGHADSNCTQRLLSLRGRLSRMLLAWRSNVVQQCSIATAGGGAAIEVRHDCSRPSQGLHKCGSSGVVILCWLHLECKWQSVSL